MDECEGLWTVDDVAEFLRLRPKTVRGRVSRGAIPHRKIDGLVRFVPAEIRRWVEEGAAVKGGKTASA